jgi:hypothetical protein
LWTLASYTVFLHSWWSLATACQFLIPMIFKSSSTSSIHLLRGLPLFLVPSILNPISFIFPGCSNVCTFHVAICTSTLFFLDLCPSRNPKRPSGWNFNCIVFSTNLFLRDWDVNPMPNPQPGGPGCLS